MYKTGISYLFLILQGFFLMPALLIAQSVEKNDYVRYNVSLNEGDYVITYRFKDHFNNFQNYTLKIPAEPSQQMIDQFGVPRWLFEPYEDNAENRRVSEEEMEKGLFLLNDNIIEVDKSAVLSHYSEAFARPIAEMIVSSLADYGADNRRNRIEFAMRFIQDIPYGVPQYNDEERHYGGVHVPPQLLIRGYGDCDSKVLLFAGILTYLIPADDIVFLNQKEHVLSAIRETPEDGLTYVRYRGEAYLIAETAGPGPRLLGQKGNYYRKQFRIEPLDIVPPEMIPYRQNEQPTIYPRQKEPIESNILVLQNESVRKLQFQISPDNRRWESLSLDANQAGKYIFETKVKLFLRLRSGRKEVTTYQIGTGKAYTITWNDRKNRWEISS